MDRWWPDPSRRGTRNSSPILKGVAAKARIWSSGVSPGALQRRRTPDGGRFFHSATRLEARHGGKQGVDKCDWRPMRKPGSTCPDSVEWPWCRVSN